MTSAAPDPPEDISPRRKSGGGAPPLPSHSHHSDSGSDPDVIETKNGSKNERRSGVDEGDRLDDNRRRVRADDVNDDEESYVVAKKV